MPDYSYSLVEFFKDDTDDSKLLAAISNEYSKINSGSDDKWYCIAKMVLSERNYRALLVKYRYLIEDINRKNFPFYYEKRSNL